LIDVSESPIERPKKKRHYYSGKKKRHTQKTQIVSGPRSKKIICTAFDKGETHDFRLYKERKTGIYSTKTIQVDTWYQGLQKLNANTVKYSVKIK